MKLTYISAEGSTLKELSRQVDIALNGEWPRISQAEGLGYQVDLASHNSYYVPPDLWPATGDIRVPGLFVETFVFVYYKPSVYEKV